MWSHSEGGGILDMLLELLLEEHERLFFITLKPRVE